MKKHSLVVLVTFLFSVLWLPQAQASAGQDALAAIIGPEGTGKIQTLLNLKKNIEQGDRQAAAALLTNAIVSQSGSTKILSDANLQQAAVNALRQNLQENISRKILPYEQQIKTISSLFNINSLLFPAPVADDSESPAGIPQGYKQVLNMTATAYAPGPLDNGKWNNQTYMGGLVQKGVAAVDPRVIPMGAKLWIPGYGEALAVDQGRAIKGNRIDLAFNDRQQALDYGIQKVKVYVMN